MKKLKKILMILLAAGCLTGFIYAIVSDVEANHAYYGDVNGNGDDDDDGLNDDDDGLDDDDDGLDDDDGDGLDDDDDDGPTVVICHFGTTISVPLADFNAHLLHGDIPGACQ